MLHVQAYPSARGFFLRATIECGVDVIGSADTFRTKAEALNEPKGPNI